MIRKSVIATALALGLTLAIPSGTAVAAGPEGTLKHIKKTGVIKLGYRENSMPFSFVGVDNKPTGYSVELCRIVADDVARQLGIAKLKTQWVAVDATTRFSSLKSGKVDIVCGNTTETLSRRAEFDFSLTTFADGAGLLFRQGEKPASIEGMKGHRVAVVKGTTTEKVLEDQVNNANLGVQLVKVDDHDEAIKALNEKTATAYAADRTVLLTTAIKHGEGQQYELSEVQFSYEPYALTMRRDADLRLAVDRSLARLYRSAEISPLLKRWFGSLGSPGESLKAVFFLNALPE